MKLTKRPAYPSWFWCLRRLANPRDKSVEVEGATISYLTWGKAGDPPVLLLHGGGASADWWEGTALYLTSHGYFLVAPNFSGCGRSSWRDSYDLDQSAREAWACLVAEGAANGAHLPVCVAHSFGSEVGLRLALAEKPAIAQLILVDSLIGMHHATSDDPRRTPRARSFYPSRSDAIGRFSTIPRDNFGPAFLRYEVARKSLEKISGEDGSEQWSWLADPNVVNRMTLETRFNRVNELRRPIDFITGLRSSLATPEFKARQAELAPADAEFVPIAGAGHHILLDTPRELALAIVHLINKRSDRAAA
jgi:pimeloyl-ACP methyl ester carboxylesterase